MPLVPLLLDFVSTPTHGIDPAIAQCR